MPTGQREKILGTSLWIDESGGDRGKEEGGMGAVDKKQPLEMKLCTTSY